MKKAGGPRKANAKATEEYTTGSIKALIPSAGISATIKVKDGKLKIKTEGRPSGQMADGSHGDHVTAQILSAHGIRRAANGTKVAEIDDLRNVRESIFSFISSIAVLNGAKQHGASTGASATASGIGTAGSNCDYVVNPDARDGLYARINVILDEYNAERYKNTKLSVLEEIGRVENSALLQLTEAARTVIDREGGFRGFFDAYLEQNRASNRRLICDTFAKLIETTSTYYYRTPNTAYPKISGYEASESEGGNINVALSRLDEICNRLKEDAERSTSNVGRSGLRRKTGTPLSISANICVQEELNNKDKEFESLKNEAVRSVENKQIDTEKLARRRLALSGQVEKLQRCVTKGNDPLQYIALKLKDLFHYPEIGADIDVTKIGSRTNDPEEFYNQVAKHLFIAFNVYPELAQDYDDKNRIVRLFINEVINHVTDLGVPQGWSSLQRMDIGEHMVAVNIRLNELDMTKADNLYTSTVGYRSRASSGAMEDIKGGIIGSAMNYVTKNFGLEEGVSSNLEKRLGELILGVNEGTFRQEVADVIESYCKRFDIEESKINKLQNILLLNKAKEIGIGARK